MNDFYHVDSEFLRNVLIGKNSNIKAIYGAAYITEYFFSEDLKSTIIPLEVMAQREKFCDDMTECMNIGDYDGAVAEMQKFWSV